jgi:ABC-type hemin transport system ATPase subunit
MDAIKLTRVVNRMEFQLDQSKEDQLASPSSNTDRRHSKVIFSMALRELAHSTIVVSAVTHQFDV